jgi:predicted TIM-barrel fold metal-dependent hydrolase
MAERHSTPAPTDGAIDLMYFPPARRISGSGATEVRCHEPVEPVIGLKQESNLGYVFVTQCKRWSCERRIYCEDTHLDEVLRYTSPYPEHFIGIGAFNPLEIAASTHETEIGIQQHGFRGVYVHPGSFGIALADRRMYPLYAKALEWKVPIILDLRVLPAESRSARATELEQVANDLSNVNFVIAQSPWTSEEMLRISENFPNVYFCFDTAAMLTPSARAFANSPVGHARCLWGSNGLPWKEALADIDHLELPYTSALLRDNAAQLFRLRHLPRRKAKPFVETESAPIRIVAE